MSVSDVWSYGRGTWLVAILALAAPAGQAVADSNHRHDAGTYQRQVLVSNGAVPADHLDGNLVNAWGIAFNPTGPVWVADNGSGLSTLYDGTGTPLSLVVQIPSPGNPAGGGNPTGIVFNISTTGFAVSNGTVTAPSRFLFATEDGLIAGWAPAVDPVTAMTAVDHSGPDGAVYKGLAQGADGTRSLLYAADFHHGRIDVFDEHFMPAVLPAGAFTDPALPAGYAPFGLQTINGNIYVSYAQQDADGHDDVQGPGKGYIDVYGPSGNLIERLVSRGRLNAPWGMALAPASFGKLGGRLLVGNFGDGKINAYDLATGDYEGRMLGPDRQPLVIDGLWGLAFGNGFRGQPVDTLFYAAGPNAEADGDYGRIDVVPGQRGHH